MDETVLDTVLQRLMKNNTLSYERTIFLSFILMFFSDWYSNEIRLRFDDMNLYLERSPRTVSDITYVKSNSNFDNQFDITHKRKLTSFQRRSRYCHVSIIESKSDHFNKYLNEKQARINKFNNLLTKKLRADKSLSLDSFKLLRQLGEGSYGTVFLAYHGDTNEYVALKVVKKSTLVDTNEQNTIISERQYAFALDHPNIVNINKIFSQ